MSGTIEDSVRAAGFDHRRDERSEMDGKHTLFDPQTGVVIGRLTAEEAAAYCEVFNWTSGTGERWIFAVGMMTAWLAEQPHDFTIYDIDVTEDHYRHVINKHGVEQWRLDRLDADHLHAPLLFADMGDGTQLLIDGNHRVVRRWQLGYRTARAYVLPRTWWSNGFAWRVA